MTPDMTRHVPFAMSLPTRIGMNRKFQIRSVHPKSKILVPHFGNWNYIGQNSNTKSKTRIPKSKTQNPNTPQKELWLNGPKVKNPTPSNTQNPSQKFEFWLYGLVVFDFQHTKAQAAGELSEQQRAVNLDPAARRTEEMQRRLREAKKKTWFLGRQKQVKFSIVYGESKEATPPLRRIWKQS